MPESTVIKMSRRKLLVGIATCVFASGFQPLLGRISDEIIIQNGWLLKKSDVK